MNLNRRRELAFLNLYTIMGLGFLALTALAYIDHDIPLASFYLLMGGAMLLGKVAVIMPRNKTARILADIGVILLALNALQHYGFTTVNLYTLISWVVLIAAIIEAIYVAKKY
ncbi:hypothetical protein PYJP_12570 [Pyrofollis japonicus]|uniref:hypothetical protein n=1 Tax=Pyrofollis japonicus TaxID=3060460 RepID=UPI00295BB6F1|nr:hypothetical protein [Pyrofollis japonicus]BEP17905.1 hypothetical protein PYJP_12570 [Pyrofollis japonicus]